MFGFSFSEVVLIGVVALVAVGPQRLPGMLKNLGLWMRKLRKMTTEVRQQTGIDEMLKAEGLQGGLNELRGLMRGGGVAAPAAPLLPYQRLGQQHDIEIDHTREYPPEGPDAKGALPDDLTAPDEPDPPEPTPEPETVPVVAAPEPPPDLPPLPEVPPGSPELRGMTLGEAMAASAAAPAAAALVVEARPEPEGTVSVGESPAPTRPSPRRPVSAPPRPASGPPRPASTSPAAAARPSPVPPAAPAAVLPTPAPAVPPDPIPKAPAPVDAPPKSDEANRTP